ncbi:hypothetical protein BpHYR1_034404, partial [Brachionus plicatilis]
LSDLDDDEDDNEIDETDLKQKDSDDEDRKEEISYQSEHALDDLMHRKNQSF